MAKHSDWFLHVTLFDFMFISAAILFLAQLGHCCLLFFLLFIDCLALDIILIEFSILNNQKFSKFKNHLSNFL
jgi:hypothetical protein